MMADNPEVTVRKIDLAWEMTKLALGALSTTPTEWQNREKRILDSFRNIYPDISKTISGDVTKPS